MIFSRLLNYTCGDSRAGPEHMQQRDQMIPCKIDARLTQVFSGIFGLGYQLLRVCDQPFLP